MANFHFNRIKTGIMGAYRLSTVTSLARGANRSGVSRSARRSRGSSQTRFTTVSLQDYISSQRMLGS